MKNFLVCILAICGATAAHSATLTVDQSIQDARISWNMNPGPNASDPKNSLTDPSSSQLSIGNKGDCQSSCLEGTAFQSPTGNSQAQLEISWARPTDPRNSASATTTHQRTYTNLGLTGSGNGTFTYTLKNMEIEVLAGSGGPGFDGNPFEDSSSDAVGMRIGYAVFVDNILTARHGFTLWGGTKKNDFTPSWETPSEGGLAPVSMTPTDCFQGDCNGMLASFDTFTRTINLGRIGIGESRTVRTEMWVEAGGFSSEWFGRAKIGDPNGPQVSSGLIDTTPTSPVPLPAGLPLMLGALALLGALRRRI